MSDDEDNSYSHEDDTGMTLHDICNWNHPDHVAIEYRDTQSIIFINYDELRAAKEMISDLLLCIKGFQFIGINSDIPEYCIPSLMLGIISSGHSFVNLPEESTTRENLINSLNLQHLFARYVTSDGDVMHQVTVHNACICLIKHKHMPRKNMDAVKKNLYAYAISTSGTTGVPKIVRVPHSCIVPNILHLRQILTVTALDKIAQFTNITFDPGIIEIFLALVAAATLFMFSKRLKYDGNRVLHEIYSNRVSILQTTPSLLLHSWSVERIRASILSNDTALRIFLLGGEPFPKEQLISEIKHPQNTTKIYNIYGITEVSCWSSINEVNTCVQFNTRSLGDVLSGTVFQVRNDIGEIVTKGTGSLHIGSDTRICVINDETMENLERPVFRDSGDIVDIGEDGRIFYKGRKNSIVKRFGNKIDLTNIEKAVLELSFVKTCYPVWDEEHHKLHLCLVTTKQITEYPDMKVVVTKCLHTLDPFYKPDKIHFLKYIKFTSTGKISMEFLRSHCEEDKIINSKVIDIDFERSIEIFKEIWQDNLNRADAAFMKLGGTSVIALQMSAAVSEALNTEFPELIGMLLRDATFDQCVTYIKKTLFNNSGNQITRHSEHDDKQSVFLEDITVVNKMVENNSLGLKQKHLYQWYKCRGKRYGNVPMINEAFKFGSKVITSIQILNTCNLQKCVDASPTVFQCSEGTSYATVGSHSGVICTIELDGEKFISFQVKLPDRIEASVLILDDFKGVVGCYDGCVYCLHLKTGEILWKYQTADIVKCTAITCEEQTKIFFGSYDCYAYCISAKDASEVWKVKASNGSITASGCLHAQSNSVLFGTLDGTCLALHQSSGKVLWKHKMKDPIFVAPVTLNSGLVLFCSVAGTLSCFNIDANIEMWKFVVNGNVFSYIVTRHDSVTKCQSIILCSHNKNVYRVVSKDDTSFKTEPVSKILFEFQSSIFATPWCEGDFLFVACTDGNFNVYSFSENKLLRTVKLPGDVFSSPVVHNNLAIVGCRDNNAYILKLV